MRYLSFFACILTFCALSFQVIAQHPAYLQYTVDDGLPSDEMHDLEQDDHGYLWFATDRGVARFDGKSFTNYTTSDGLADNMIHEIFKDATGKLWFVGYSSRLSYYQNGTIQPYPYNDVLQSQLNAESILKDFYAYPDGTIYYTSSSAHTIAIDSTGQLIDLFTEKEFGSYSSLKKLDDKLLYLRPDHPGKEIRISIGSDTVFPEHDRSRIYSSQLSANEWILSLNGSEVHYFNEDQISMLQRFDRHVFAIEADSADIWIATERGIYRRTGNSPFNEKGIHVYLPQVFISGLLKDLEGGIWATSIYNGIFYLPNPDVLSYREGNGISFNYVSAVEMDHKERLFIGGKGGEINVILPNGKNIPFLEYPHRQGIVNDFVELEGERMYFSSSSNCIHLIEGLTSPMVICHASEIEKKGTALHSVLLAAPRMGTIKRMAPNTARNAIVLAGNREVCVLYQDQDQISIEKKQQNVRTTSVLMENDNKILLGTIQGLYSLDLTNDRMVFDGDRFPLLKNRIGDIKKMNGAVVAIATEGAGLLLRYSDSLYQISREHGLNSADLNTLAIDGNVIWIGSDQGLNRVTLTNLNPLVYEVKSFTSNDGLISDYINQLAVHGKNVYVATRRGLTIFSEEAIAQERKPPLVHITRVRVNNRDTMLTAHSTLDYNQNKVEFSYAGISMRSGGRMDYKFRLIGLDTNWTHTNAKQTQFTNIPPGAYQFQLVVRDLNGDWNSEMASMQFEILPPLWRRWWVLMPLFLLTIGILYALINWRINYLKKIAIKEEKISREKLELELKALKSQLNPHFIFNSLNAIKNYILQNDQKASDRFLSDFARFIRLMFQSSSKAYISLSEETELLTHYLDLEKKRFDDQFHYEISIDPQMEVDKIGLPSLLIYPYVEVAVLHRLVQSKDNSCLKIEFKMQGDHLICILRDNVKDALRENQKKEGLYDSLGIQITEQRLRMETGGEVETSFVKQEDQLDSSGRKVGNLVTISVAIEEVIV